MRYKSNVLKDTPQSELLLRNVLNQNTSPSGQSNLPQNIESIATVRPRHTIPAGTAAFIILQQTVIKSKHIYMHAVIITS